ncbi:type II CRISPR-associated endonuclease Cas1 [Rothia sp. P5766]|uniref:type II CRISPR-associated endonuclease Cas1 n=1 Tax=Rothia sp. P5766 TaxID=3402656 RepID=UPI003AEC6AE9
MDSKWRILDLTAYEGFLSYERGRIKVGEQSVPLAEVDFILVGQKCTWGYGLVAGLERFDVAMAVCDWRNQPISVLYHWSENTRVFARHEAQAHLSVPRRKNAWMRLVKAKIRGQAFVLRSHNPVVAQELEACARAVRSGDPTNMEAQAARLYWSAFLPEGRIYRDPQADDVANGLLNYGYTILRGRVLTRLVATGLSPTLSLFHRNRSNVFALADDLIEPFRPAVDEAVLGLLAGGACEVGKAEKTVLASVLGASGQDSAYSVRTGIEKLCQNFAMYAEGEREVLLVPVWQGREFAWGTEGVDG